MALRKISLSLVAIVAMATGSMAADAQSSAAYGDGLAAAFTKGKIDGQVRALYMLQDNVMYTNTANNNNSGFGLGGNIGYTTAPYYGISAGAKFYTSQTLASSANFQQNGSLNPYFDNTATTNATAPQSYSTLGQAFLQGQYGKSTLKIGRQELNTPLAGADDNYMIPNLFQGAVFINQDLPEMTLVGAYINGMQGGTTGDSKSNVNPQTSFNSMSRSALGRLVDVPTNLTGGSTIGNTPVWALALVSSGLPYTTMQVWYYNNTDVLQATYIGLDAGYPVAKGWKIGGAVQYYNLAAQGKTKTLLTNAGQAGITNNYDGTINNLNYGVTGFKVNLENPLGVTPEVAGTMIGGKTGTAYAFGAWGGYPDYTDMAYVTTANFTAYGAGGTGNGNANAKGSNQWKFSLNGDLSKYNLGNRSLQVAFGMYDFAKSNNGGNNVDADVWDFVYTCKGALVKNFDLKLFYEAVKYNSQWQNAGGTIKTMNIAYLRGIYKF